ncbi:MAG: hypothetical protein NXI25_26925 [bacterium]|nr:hypothetical protein [bacterium]
MQFFVWKTAKTQRFLHSCKLASSMANGRFIIASLASTMANGRFIKDLLQNVAFEASNG